MELLLIRHGKAEPGDPQKWGGDFKRPLSTEGVKEFTILCRSLSPLFRSIKNVYSSPYLRAQQTADILVKFLERPAAVTTTDFLGDNFSVGAVISLLGTSEKDGKAAIIGHEPDMSLLAGRLLSSTSAVSVHFRKGAVMGLSFPENPVEGKGTLEFFFLPEYISHSLDLKDA